MKQYLLYSGIALTLVACNGNTEPVVDNTPPPPAPVINEPVSTVTQYEGEMLSGMHTVTLNTTMGDVVLELNADAAPMTVTNFIALAQQGYYDDTTFHRIIPDFMIQGGDPEGNGTGGESAFGPTFKDEINANTYDLDTLLLSDTDDSGQLPEELKDKTVKEFYELQGYMYDDSLESLPMDRGYIAMANRGPNTNGSQFFIIEKEGGTPWLEGRHTVFGQVVEGMDVIDAIAAVETNEQDAPVTPITFTVTVASEDAGDAAVIDEDPTMDENAADDAAATN